MSNTGITQSEFDRARGAYPSLQLLSNLPTGRIDAVAVVVKGIRGGEKGLWFWGPKGRVTYHTIVGLSRFPDKIPDVWILRPDDSAIKHLNIFHGDHCYFLNRSLPSVCWGQFTKAWTRAPRSHRTLEGALAYLKQFLNDQNPDSPAR